MRAFAVSYVSLHLRLSIISRLRRYLFVDIRVICGQTKNIWWNEKENVFLQKSIIFAL
jgi:hypothetical protein